MIKKIVILGLTPFLLLILLLLRIPFVNDWIVTKWNYQHASIIIGIVVVLIFLFTYYVQVAIPYIKSIQLMNNRWKAIKSIIDKFISDFDNEVEVNVNIMVPKKKLVWREPKENSNQKMKFSWFVDVFDIFWQSDHKVNDLRLTINQGLCGLVYRQGSNTLVDILNKGESTNGHQFNLTEKQIEKTKNIVGLASCCIKISKYGEKQKKIKLGVINVEIKDKDLNTASWLEDKDKRAIIVLHINNLEKNIRYLV